MTAEATLSKDANANAIDITAPAALSAGQVLQLADGRAAVKAGLAAAASGDPATLQTAGQFTVTKTSGVVILDGGEVMWDHSANSATIPLYGTSKDFYLGRAVGDAASTDTTMVVELNAPKDSAYITLQNDSFASALVNTAGTLFAAMQGGGYSVQFSATAEAQKADLLSDKAFAKDSNWIFEAVVNVITAADADVVDVSIGVANATHASDADSITESAFFHLDSNGSTNILAESDDGTTEVAATDTTKDWTAGTAFHLMLDGRDSENVKYYVNGVEVLAATANLGDIDDATGPLKALFHVEKTANDSLFSIRLNKMEVRLTADVQA